VRISKKKKKKGPRGWEDCLKPQNMRIRAGKELEKKLFPENRDGQLKKGNNSGSSKKREGSSNI